MRTRIIALSALALVVMFGLLWAQARFGAAPLDRTSAWVACQQFVEERLAAPATARYPALREATVTQTDGRELTFAAHVDAANRFGAPVRTPFTCTVRHLSGDTWRLARLDLR